MQLITCPRNQMAEFTHPFGYTGRRYEADLGLYYYRARWYDPELGTFLETDPIGAADYINLYSYVGLDPMGKTDPTGLYDIVVQFLAGKTITTTIDDRLSLTRQQFAESQVRGAAAMTLAMEVAGTLPASSAAAINAHSTMSISRDISGINTTTHNFNQNIAELESNSVNQSGFGNAAVAILAGNIIHDGHHAVQSRAGTLVTDAFISEPHSSGGTASQIQLFEWGQASNERQADLVQIDFLRAAPFASERARQSVISSLSNRSSADIRARYTTRRPTP